jgi:Bacterial regulatory proteins, luxR family
MSSGARSSREKFRSAPNLASGLSFKPLRLLSVESALRSTADQLHLSVKTIETNRAHIKEKLGFKDASEMVRFAIEWVGPGEGKLMAKMRVESCKR